MLRWRSAAAAAAADNDDDDALGGIIRRPSAIVIFRHKRKKNLDLFLKNISFSAGSRWRRFIQEKRLNRLLDIALRDKDCWQTLGAKGGVSIYVQMR